MKKTFKKGASQSPPVPGPNATKNTMGGSGDKGRAGPPQADRKYKPKGNP